MLTLREIESFLLRTPLHLQDIVFELRNLIAAAAPDAVEVIHWGGLSYFHDAPWEYLKQLIEESSHLDPRSLQLN